MNQYVAFLNRCGNACRVVLGDARLWLTQHSQRYAILVLDAFSSDAIPIRLITKEAIATYLDHLQPNGAIALHISHRHLALRPVLARLARDFASIETVVVPHGPMISRTSGPR